MAPDLKTRSTADLTTALVGHPLTLDELRTQIWLGEGGNELAPLAAQAETALWVGSAGYECHRDSAVFAAKLGEQGVECLIDVRELPISRRRGYAKTALAETLLQEGIEYVHAKVLGNPKPYRDLYKSGRIAEGREAYRELLVTERLDAVESIVPLLRQKRCALMCVEHDEQTCHRSVIFESIEVELGVPLAVAQVT